MRHSVLSSFSMTKNLWRTSLDKIHNWKRYSASTLGG